MNCGLQNHGSSNLVRTLLALCYLTMLDGPWALADCGKIVILRCPPGMDPGDFDVPGVPQGGASNPEPVEPGEGDISGDDGEDPNFDEEDLVDLPGGDTPEDFQLAAKGIVAAKGVFREPEQYGLVAWNGKQELLILSTGEQALTGGEKTMMLSFMPLPGKCRDIKEAKTEVIDAAHKLVYSKLGTSRGKGVELTRKFGPHNIFVWKVDDRDEFINRVQAYIQSKFGGRAVALFTPDTAKVLDQYLDDGYKYFAFDLVDMSNEKPSEKRAIAYYFDTKYLYYPLRVSQSGGTDKTAIRLAVFTKSDGQFAFHGLDPDRVTVVGDRTVKATNAELKGIDPMLAKLFGSSDAVARIWRLDGQLDEFEKDLIVANP